MVLAGVNRQTFGSDLVKEDILPVPAFCGEVFEIAILTDSMLQAQLLPELTTDCEHVSIDLPSNITTTCTNASVLGDSLLLPHWPAWMVMISLLLSQRVRGRR